MSAARREAQPSSFGSAALYNRAVLRGEGLVGSRAGSLGRERSPALWAGDQPAEWRAIDTLVVAGLSAGLSGMPFWSHDIGGYLGDPTPELYRRWTQFGAWSPMMQYDGISAREPWLFGDEALENYRLNVGLRMNLLPTFIELGRIAAETGLPLMRPMFMVFPEDAAFRDDFTQYMLGTDILVAPITNPDQVRADWADRCTDFSARGREIEGCTRGRAASAQTLRLGARPTHEDDCRRHRRDSVEGSPPVGTAARASGL